MKTIGLAGFGLIGKFLYEHLATREDTCVTAVWDVDPQKTVDLDPALVCQGPEDLGARQLDLIVEVAHPDAVHALWPHLTSEADLLVASMTSMADPEFRHKVESDAQQAGRAVYLPHGAVLGLDGLRDGQALVESVSITTTKHPRNLGCGDLSLESPHVLFEGATRAACNRFPRNVNVHAAIALAGIGFENTQSKIVADPNTNKMHHFIKVRGRGLSWNIEIESFSTGEVTGSYTPESLFRSVLRILLEQKGFCIT